MKNKREFKRQLESLILLSIILASSFFAFVPMSIFISDSDVVDDDSNDSKELDNDFNQGPIKKPELSVLGNDTWWDEDFYYRRLINVTNPYSVNFTNFGVSLTFNYDALGATIQNDLDDIRIVEYYNDVPILRDYYVVQDYPDPNYATVWFDNNITEDHSEVDTYMYYGNQSVLNAESTDVLDSFGYVRNGDFEYDTSEDTKFIPYGWNFTDDPIDSMQGVDFSSNGIPDDPYNNTVIADSWEHFQYKLVTTESVDGYEGVGSGDNAYKFGNKANSLPNTQTLEYVGTFFSFPFTVPIIEGADLALDLWRNAHTYIFDQANAPIDNDGYYIRICNGSASKYTWDVNLHEDADNVDYNNYVEAYGGNSWYAARYRDEYQLREHFDGDVVDTRGDDPPTGYTSINLTAYMGQDVFIEIGSWGQEDGDPYSAKKTYRGGFFQIDSVEFNYTLTGTIDELQAVESVVTVAAVDVDGRIVRNAEIFIFNNSNIIDSGVAIDGTYTFTGIKRGRYNITANYTLGNEVFEVFNSYSSGIDPYYFNGINYTVQIQLDLWTIDFEIVDWDGIPLKYGYIEVNNSYGAGSILLQNLTLDENGKTTFRWWNTTSYYYKVYYKNDDYSIMPIALNESYIRRSDYIQNNVKTRAHTINIIDSHVGSYSISERIYTDNLTSTIGNKKINRINITLANMENYLSDISIYYIDKDNSTDGNLIYSETYPSPPDDIKDDFIQLDISLIDNDNLKSDNYEAYGILIEVNGFNATTSNGVITVVLTETCNIYNKSALARINIKTIFYNEITEEIDELSSLVLVVDNATGESLVNLTSSSSAIEPLEDGYAYGQINEVPFWYSIGQVYNFTIIVGNLNSTSDPPGLEFNITTLSSPGPSQWTPGLGEYIGEYNFTLYGNSSITFFIKPIIAGLNFTDFDSNFNQTYGEIEAFWGDDLDYWVYFLFTDDGWVTDDIVEKPPASVFLDIKVTETGELLFTKELGYDGNGNYSITINSGILSAGNDFVYYTFEITGDHPMYDNPAPVTFLVKVKAIPTSIASYNYESRLLVPNNLYAQNYAEFVNITIAYNISAGGSPLSGASVAYTWDFSPGTLDPDQVWSDFYTMTINTSEALSIGIKLLTITASLENYSLGQITIYLNILKRGTTLNGKSGLIYSNPSIWVQDSQIYNFTYKDKRTTDVLGDLEIAIYSWQELNDDGDVILGRNGDGSLSQNADHSYSLNFGTSYRRVGFYQIYITLGKNNYEERFALLNIEIKKREFDADLSAKGLKDDQINIVSGNTVELEIELNDETRGNIPLTGAKVVLEIGDEEYEFDEDEPGIYTYKFDTTEYEAFYTSLTLTGEIIIKKTNFTSDELDITIVIEMEEIFEGVPTFYFIMVVAAICAVIGSLTSYRVIQQARIPQHVKKLRLLKKKIKAKDTIPRTLSFPTREQLIKKLFGAAFESLGISVDETLGIKDTKPKTLDKIKKTLKQRGGDE